MKHISWMLVLVLLPLMSCENEEKVQSDIDKLRIERSELQNEVIRLNEKVSNANYKLQDISNKLVETQMTLNIYKEGRIPRYIIKVRLKQSHISLDLSKHMKDAMNAIEFEIPVDKEFYDSVNLNTQIVDKFRSGSLLMEGSFGKWNMSVISKRIV